MLKLWTDGEEFKGLDTSKAKNTRIVQANTTTFNWSVEMVSAPLPQVARKWDWLAFKMLRTPAIAVPLHHAYRKTYRLPYKQE